jgi:hypothetical protein
MGSELIKSYKNKLKKAWILEIKVVYLSIIKEIKVMAGKKGQFAVCKEWAKHLRKKYKRIFWSSERALSKKDIKKL